MTQTPGLRSPRGPWPVGLAVALVAMTAGPWTIACRATDRGESAAVGVAPESAGAAATPVQDYLEFASTPRDRQNQASGADSDYIAEGLRRLAGALGSLGVGSPDLQIDLRVAAEHHLLNPTSTAHTAVVRDALVSAAEALEREQGTGAGDLRRLAESIRPDTPLPDQEAAVSEFFGAAAQVVERLSSVVARGTRPDAYARARYGVAAVDSPL